MAGKARLALIADDLTGALDSSAPFAIRGFRTSISFSDNDDPEGIEVQVYSTESRNSSDEQAAAGIRRVIGASNVEAAPIIYKKIDSTLRGPIAAELKTLFNLLEPERALICPAFPDQGRTVVDGHVLIDGVPLSHTIFGRDIASGSLWDLVSAIGLAPCHLPLETLRLHPNDARQVLAESALVIADAETSQDLRLLARYALGAHVRLLAGSAGLAAGLASELPELGQPKTEPSRQRSLDQNARVLVVAGSLHGRTLAQIEVLSTVPMPAIILAAPPPDPEMPRRADIVAAELANEALRVVQERQPAALIVTGGDIASAVCRRLSIDHLRLVGQVEPGMPVSCIGGGIADGLRMVTKAGGFGDARALVRAAAYLTA